MSIPGDSNIKVKGIYKLEKLAAFCIAVSRMWDIQSATGPLIIGALGSIPQNLNSYIKKNWNKA